MFLLKSFFGILDCVVVFEFAPENNYEVGDKT